MKFYHVEDLEVDHLAVIWAESKKEAEKLYREEITDEEVAIFEVDVNEVYQSMLGADLKDTEREYADPGVMGRLHDVIRSTTPMIVIQSGVDWGRMSSNDKH